MIESINPYNLEVVEKFKELTKKQIDDALDCADKRFQSWKKSVF